MITYFWIALGGALGSIARYGCSSLIAGSVGESFPWGTLVVNVVRSFIIGFFALLAIPMRKAIIAAGNEPPHVL